MAELTSFKININKHLDLWVQAGDDREAFHEESVLMWEALFNEAHLTSEELDEVLIRLWILSEKLCNLDYRKGNNGGL
ncbi:hypothetical protein ABES25_01275 [Bacillus gobiensis]|uniref:hypothetical protein n=1 Tax=Bacillus gobiensis TaxID=1441095 RepID=UPI003D19BD84